jgi:hypothetical protein
MRLPGQSRCTVLVTFGCSGMEFWDMVSWDHLLQLPFPDRLDSRGQSYLYSCAIKAAREQPLGSGGTGASISRCLANHRILRSSANSCGPANLSENTAPFRTSESWKKPPRWIRGGSAMIRTNIRFPFDRRSCHGRTDSGACLELAACKR